MDPLQQIESLWFEAAASAIVSQVAQFPQERFYAGAFWLCYVDYSLFGTPCFAMNTESHLAVSSVDEPENFTRWSPANWRFNVLDTATKTMLPLYDSLSRSLAGQDDAKWEAAMEEHFQVLARVSRKLTKSAREQSGPFAQTKLPPDFVVGVFEEREGEPVFSKLVRLSIAPEILPVLPSPTWKYA